MKYAIVIPDGAADWPLESLQGRTPLEVAQTPNLDRIGQQGRLGLVTTIPQDLAPGSEVALMSLLGYDPLKYYTGRAPIEAVGCDMDISRTDMVFRCNLVTVADGEMADYAAGHISTAEATVLIDSLNDALATDEIRFYAGVGYRHLMVYRGDAELDIETTPPHDIIGQEIEGFLPGGRGSEMIIDLMNASPGLFAPHPVNDVRVDLGENPATMIWLWGQGHLPTLPTFQERYGLSGAAVTAVDIVRGVAKLIGWQTIDVFGATGYYDTNYEGKAQAAIDALDEFDIVLVHVEASDEASHNGDVKEKIAAIERVDNKIVGPLLQRLSEFDAWHLLVMPDHRTPIAKRTHVSDPVPFGIIGTGVSSLHPGPYTEAHAATTGLNIEVGHELMEFFLKR
ncbi:MAG: cofactor-independent phosphoglycerate mutase [Phycisphaerae bacterium]|jgi:2,3-bisphosphoglycerate-independent phosphoglycerate mutase|nr:cofactor-independent phosphoglycerate mutase [Phycisphaerae bacterium]